MRITAHICGALSIASYALALGEQRVISFPTTQTHLLESHQQAVFSHSSASHFLIANAKEHHATPLLLDSKDDQAIHVAAQTFAHDVYRVTGLKPDLYNDTLPEGVHGAVIVGSISSRLISEIHDSERLAHLEGKWESYDMRVVKKPLKSLEKALVVVGSDRVSKL
jgi:hypothetical protein